MNCLHQTIHHQIIHSHLPTIHPRNAIHYHHQTNYLQRVLLLKTSSLIHRPYRLDLNLNLDFNLLG